MLEFIGDVLNEVLGPLFEMIMHNTIYKLCFWITKGILFVLYVLDSMFRVVAGLDTVKFNGYDTYLQNVFLEHDFVRTIYSGMALIGIGMAFFFAILGVIRKAADVDDKERRTLGGIVRNLVRTIFVILSLTMFMQMLVYASNILLERINFVFDNASSLGKVETVHFTDEEYAAMARILNTAGNYSLNPSYRSRYNIDACYNDMGSDLQQLWDSGKFNYYYKTTKKVNGKDKEVNTWQSVIQKIMNASYPGKKVAVDVYNESVSKAVLNAMDVIRTDGSLFALQDYQTGYKSVTESVNLDTTLFLMGTLNAAKNPAFNVNPSVDDALRRPYYVGEKSIYDLDEVDEDFNISIFKMDYVVIWASGIIAIPAVAGLLFSCVARIFNMLLLYLAAPPLLATSPLDGGQKSKQWMTAFIIQTFAVFGTIIAMRMIFIFVPILASSKLQIFSNNVLNLLAKVVIIIIFYKVADKSNSIITSVLAENAGITGTSNIEQTGRIASEMWKETFGGKGGKGGGGGGKGGGGGGEKQGSESGGSHKDNTYSNSPSRNTQYDSVQNDENDPAQFNGGSVTDDAKKDAVKNLAASQGIPPELAEQTMNNQNSEGGGPMPNNNGFQNVMNVVNPDNNGNNGNNNNSNNNNS